MKILLIVIACLVAGCDGQNSSSPGNSGPTYTFLVTGTQPACEIEYTLNGTTTYAINSCGPVCGTGCCSPSANQTLPWNYSFSASSGVSYTLWVVNYYSSITVQLQKNGTTVNQISSGSPNVCGYSAYISGTLP